MAKTSPPRDPVTVVIPVYNAADRIGKVVLQWADLLTRHGRDYELLIVNDGSTDGTSSALEQISGRVKHLRILTHQTRRGFGACLRTALDEATYPLFFYTSTDYPYTPADIRGMLDRIEVRDELFNRQPDLISGCRTGRRAPFLVRGVGKAWRLFWRIALGLPLQKPQTWLGWRESLHGIIVGWIFGVPLADVNSAFKLFRTSFLKRFPIQSDGDFVHTELVAKATFLTSLMDEMPLTAKPDTVPRGSCGGLWHLITNPDFGNPTLMSKAPAAPATATLP